MPLILILLINTLAVYGEVGVSAVSAVAIDAKSGMALYSKNAENKMPMASTTKIMTAIVALENGRLEDVTEVSERAASAEGSSMYLEKGEKISLINLLYGLMLSSGNDAAIAIAEHISGSEEEFVSLMNETAEKLGAKNTHFENPNGLPSDEHYSTAYDMAKITAYALKIPTFAEIVSTKTKKVPWEGREYNRILNNHNKLLSMYDGCIGVKTGFTKTAGRCLVSAAERNGMTVICVTLNAPDDWNDHINMYNYIFDNYENKTIISKGEVLGSVNIKGGTKESVEVICENEFSLPLKSNDKCDVSVNLSDNAQAPVFITDNLGYAAIKVNNNEVLKIPLLPKEEVNSKNIFFPKKKITFGSYLYKLFLNWFTFNKN